MRFLPWLSGIFVLALCGYVLWFAGIWAEIMPPSGFATQAPNPIPSVGSVPAIGPVPALGIIKTVVTQSPRAAQPPPIFQQVQMPVLPSAANDELARQTAAQLVVQGNLSLKDRQYNAAIERFDAALAQDRQSVAALLGRGKSHLGKALELANDPKQAGEFRLANADFYSALLIDARSADAYRGRCDVEMRLGDYRAAQFDAVQWERIAPADAAPYSVQANASLAVGDVVQAIGACTKALNLLGPRSTTELVPLLMQRAEAYRRRGDFEWALNDLARVMELDPGDKNNMAAARSRAGRIEFARGRLPQAEAWFKAWCGDDLESTSEQAAAWYDLGTTLLARSEFSRAVAAFDKALEKKPRDAAALNNRGTALSKLNKRSEARADFSAALEADPEYLLALQNRAALELSPGGNLVRAIADYQDLTARRPHDLRWQIALASAYRRNGDIDKAISSANAAIALDPKSAEAYFCSALAYAAKSRTEGYSPGAKVPGPKPSDFAVQCLREAVRLATEAIRYAPSAAAYKCRAYAYLKLDQIAEADADLAAARRISN